MKKKPGWGQPHAHEFKKVLEMDEITMTKCDCGTPGPPIVTVPRPKKG